MCAGCRAGSDYRLERCPGHLGMAQTVCYFAIKSNATGGTSKAYAEAVLQLYR